VIADYNREKDRVTIEETFARLVDFTKSLDAEQKRAAEEGLNQDEFALFQMLFKDTISKADRERLKLASRNLLSALRVHVQTMPNWTQNTPTQADVKMFILNNLYTSLPRPPFSDAETDQSKLLFVPVGRRILVQAAAGEWLIGLNPDHPED
jgi:type I restriction enzyme R subunit